jgi:RNA polymerase sigma factor (sigma-70 family)
MSAEVDAGEHLRLIHRVISQMGLRGDTAEEAYSEGLVAIVEAARSYDPEKGRLANWLANNIRWSILGWLNRQRQTLPLIQTEAPTENLAARTELKELIENMKEALTDKEYVTIMLEAAGFSGIEIGKKLGMSPVQVTRCKQRARAKLEKFK